MPAEKTLAATAVLRAPRVGHFPARPRLRISEQRERPAEAPVRSPAELGFWFKLFPVVLERAAVPAGFSFRATEAVQRRPRDRAAMSCSSGDGGTQGIPWREAAVRKSCASVGGRQAEVPVIVGSDTDEENITMEETLHNFGELHLKLDASGQRPFRCVTSPTPLGRTSIEQRQN
jgi:hypothetical protein